MIRIIKYFEPEKDIRSETPVDILRHFISKFSAYRVSRAEVPENIEDINTFLFSGDFLKDITNLFEAYEPLWVIIKGSKKEKLVWSIEKILGLKSPLPSVDQKFEQFRNNALTSFGLTAFYLSPKSDRTLLDQDQMFQINNVIIFGCGKPVSTQFGAYRRRDSPFNKTEMDDLDVQDYWESLSCGPYEELALTAVKFLNLPSSSYTQSFALPQQYENVPIDISEKVLALKLSID